MSRFYRPKSFLLTEIEVFWERLLRKDRPIVLRFLIGMFLGNCDLIQLVHDVIETYEKFAEEKRIQLKSEILLESKKVFCDPERTIQVLTNLLDNALKFTNTGGSIHIYGRNINGHVEVRVTDTGKGIQQENLPHVFDQC